MFKKVFFMFMFLSICFLCLSQETEKESFVLSHEITNNFLVEDKAIIEEKLNNEIKDLENNIIQELEQMEIEEGKNKWIGIVRRFALVIAIIVIQSLIICLISKFFNHLDTKLQIYGKKKFKPLKINKYQLLNTKQINKAASFILKIIKYTVVVFLLFLTIPLIFSIFPLTRNFALTLFGYILKPIKNIFFGIILYIPNLITVIVILFVIKYLLKMLKFFTNEIEKNKLVIPGFYADWAKPTFSLLKYILYAFTVAIIYPYLPGSDSAVFQGVSVFIGIIISLGSSSAIGNIIAGLVITYMRPFKIGDRIKIGEVVGFVVEKSTIITRVRTHKNEYVTFPNMMILNSCTTNYSKSIENEHGILVHVTMTMGYDIPWRTVHELLIKAANLTSRIEEEPKPFVLQLSLQDFYASYQINAYTKDIDLLPRIYSELYQNIQDVFTEAQISLTAPHFGVYTQKQEISHM